MGVRRREGWAEALELQEDRQVDTHTTHVGKSIPTWPTMSHWCCVVEALLRRRRRGGRMRVVVRSRSGLLLGRVMALLGRVMVLLGREMVLLGRVMVLLGRKWL